MYSEQDGAFSLMLSSLSPFGIHIYLQQTAVKVNRSGESSLVMRPKADVLSFM